MNQRIMAPRMAGLHPFVSLIAAVVAFVYAAVPQAVGQSYPSRPIRLVVPFSPGGSADLIARLVGQKLGDAFKQQVVIDNRAGAGGNIGVEIAARALPDGYTLLVGHVGTFAINPNLYAKLPFDPIKDFQPITLFSKLPNMMVVHPSIPARNVKELIAYAKTKPGALNYGSAGNGSAAHLAVEYFKLLTGTDFQHIPYKGTGPAVIDLLAGRVSLTITGVPPLLPHVKSGKLRPLGVASAKRLTLFPDIPTLAEAGVSGYEATQWHGVLAPARTPRPIVNGVNDALVKALRSTEVKERLSAETADAIGSTPEEFQTFIKSEIARWAPVVKASGARAD